MSGKKSLFMLKCQNYFLFSSGAIVTAYLPVYFNQVGLTTKEIGMILGVGPFVSIFSQPLWGIIADRNQSTKRTILLLIICSSFCSISLFFSKAFYPVFISMALFTFFSSPINPLTENENVNTALSEGIHYGSIRAWGSAGFSLAAFGLGPIFALIGLSRMVYVYLAFMLLIFICSKQLKESPIINRIDFRKMAGLFKNRALFHFLLLVTIVAIPHRLNDIWLGIYLTKLGASTRQIGIAWMLAAGSEMLAFFILMGRIERYNPLVLIFIASFLYALRWYLCSLVHSIEVLLLLQTMHAVTFALFYATCLRFITELVPMEMKATGQGVFSAVFGGVCGILGSLLGGWIMASYSGAFMYQICAVLSLFAGIYALGYMKLYRRREMSLHESMKLS